MSVEVRECSRCGAPCRTTREPNPDARVLRLSKGAGLCASCAITDFLRRMPPLNEILDRDPSALLRPDMQAQVGRVLEAGRSDADLSEINWTRVVENWELPVGKGLLA